MKKVCSYGELIIGFPLGSSKDAKFGIIEDNERIDWLIDDIIEALPQIDKWKLLERYAKYSIPSIVLYMTIAESQ